MTVAGPSTLDALPRTRRSYPPIGDYAVIGDCRSVALISRSGELDWLCLPRFDSPALFAALLDRGRGGTFAVRPAGASAAARRYVDDTNVLETTFDSREGRLRLTDLMPVTSEAAKRAELWPSRQVLRIVECLEGVVEVEAICDPRPEYGRVVPRVEARGPDLFHYEDRGRAVFLRSEIPLAVKGESPGARGRATLRAGERRFISLTYAEGEPAVYPTFGSDAERKLDATVQWWRTWAAKCRFEGQHRDAVMRSALTLKLMTYAPSGAVVAAPTTSLPEVVGGVRNWDYRYCWLRDASLTLQALEDLGYGEEARAFLGWLLTATGLTHPELQVMYDVHGEEHLTERDLDWLEGYAGSRPVRVGNAAEGQLQLDIYGEVLDAVAEYVRRGGRLDRAAGRMLASLGDAVCRRWREPDEGIWEPRGGRRHHTYSKAMCWVALDRLLWLAQHGQVSVPLPRFEREREAIRRAIEAEGYDERLGSYVSVFGGDRVDASLLLLQRYGYVSPRSPRMAGTMRAIRERLEKSGLVYRYLGEDDGLPGVEGAFGICGFWLVECLARQGQVAEATKLFERLWSTANDVGLFAEEIDPETRMPLGNFPQAFTHVGLIDAALTLAEITGRGVATTKRTVEHRTSAAR